MDTHRDHAENLAQVHQLRPRAVSETGAEYREWVARELNRRGRYIEAQEALYNQKMSGDPFAYLPDLARGFSDTSITDMARVTQFSYEEAQRKQAMLSPEYYAFKRVQKALNLPYIVLGVLAVLGTLAVGFWFASQELYTATKVCLFLAVWFGFGTLCIPSIGPAFLASRDCVMEFAREELQRELQSNPALDFEYMRRLADNERKVRSTAAIIHAVLSERISGEEQSS